ncbi:MAG: hypothetical protein ACXWR1_03585 [Bdellovibrionota bacterium]
MRNLLIGSLLCVTLNAPAFAAARGGDGGGFNGPTLNTISIPGAMDHGISVSDVETAYSTCLGGDAKRGLVPFTDEIISKAGFKATVYGSNLKADMVNQADLPVKSKDGTVPGGDIAVVDSSEDHAFATTMNDPNHLPEALVYSYSGSIIVRVTADDGSFVDLIPAKGDLPLPSVHFKTTVQDSQFDRWGREIKGDLMLQGVSITSLVKPQEQIQFKNRSTGHPVGFSFSYNNLISCLRSEIQNHLK